VPKEYRKDIIANDTAGAMFEADTGSSTAYTSTSAPFSIDLQGRPGGGQEGIQGILFVRWSCRTGTARNDIRIVRCTERYALSLTNCRLEYYYSLQTWPEQVRTPLKAAIKARNSGDFDRSESYFRK